MHQIFWSLKAKYFAILDGSELRWFLGFEVRHNQAAQTMSINQQNYIERMVEKFRFTSAIWVMTQMDPDGCFSKDQSPSTPSQEFQMQDVPYAQVIGSLLWQVVISRLDAAFVVGILSKFIQNLDQAHWEGVKRVIAYLGTTKHLWLMFGGHGITILKGFCDVDWAGQPHRHLISGYFFHMGARAITWSSKKNNALSSCWVLKQSTSHRCMLQRRQHICTCL